MNSSGATARQVTVSGLTNSVAYTFTVKARNTYGDSVESAASGANTPLPGLVFGDDFNGPAGGAVDPEWWVYNRCGFLGQNELEYYLPDHCTLDGAGNLKLLRRNFLHRADVSQRREPGRHPAVAQRRVPVERQDVDTVCGEHDDIRGAGSQSCHDVVLGMWPGLLWLEGQDYLTAWKTDPDQSGFANPGKAEIDVAEFNPRQGLTTYDNNYSDGSSLIHSAVNGPDISAAMHVYSVRWKPSVSLEWLRDGSRTTLATTKIMTAATRFFLMLYLQIEWGCTATATQSCYVDYVRVYDQNLG